MDAFFILERLAHMTHYSTEKSQLIHSLPSNIQIPFLSNNAQTIRENLSFTAVKNFPDARTVAWIKKSD